MCDTWISCMSPLNLLSFQIYFLKFFNSLPLPIFTKLGNHHQCLVSKHLYQFFVISSHHISIPAASGTKLLSVSGFTYSKDFNLPLKKEQPWHGVSYLLSQHPRGWMRQKFHQLVRGYFGQYKYWDINTEFQTILSSTVRSPPKASKQQT